MNLESQHARHVSLLTAGSHEGRLVVRHANSVGGVRGVRQESSLSIRLGVASMTVQLSSRQLSPG